MSDVIVPIDFETRSATDIKLGVDRYARDPECEVLTLSYRMPGAEVWRWHRGPHLVDLPQGQGPDDLLDHVRNGGKIRGWNVMFEWHIWNHVCVPKYGWPELKLEQCIDTMALAAAMNLPQNLGKCAMVLGLPDDKQKNKRGKYLIQRLCKPHKPTKTRQSKWVEDVDLFAELCDYCDQDVVTEEAVAKKLRPLTEFEQQVWLLTQRINLRGIPLAVDEIQVITQIVDREKKRLNAELAKLSGGAVPAASNRAKLLEWCNSQMEDFTSAIDFIDAKEDEDFEPFDDEDEETPALLANLRGKTVDEVLKRDDLPPHVRRALEIRSLCVQTSTAKFAKMLKIVSADGTAKNMFVYHGAGTGRWASRGGLNVQNFARPLMKKGDIATGFSLVRHGVEHGAAEAHDAMLLLYGDKVMDLMVSLLRGVLKAPEGYEYIDADYSSVENRMAAWIAGQTDKLEMFAAGLDEYKVFASRRLFKVPYDQVTDQLRQFTKPVILGGIFGLGGFGLVEYAKNYGVVMDVEEAGAAIKELRVEYDRVAAAWYRLGDIAVEAVENPGQWFDMGRDEFTTRAGKTHPALPYGKLELCCHRNFLWMRLPSGRLISWAAPRIVTRLAPWKKQHKVEDPDGTVRTVEEDVYKDAVSVEGIDQKTRQWTRFDLIGSSIFQSATQATARDILAHGTLRAEAAGYPTVLLAHDENMALVRKGWGHNDEFGQLLCAKAEWFADLPLAFEAWRGPRFQKG